MAGKIVTDPALLAQLEAAPPAPEPDVTVTFPNAKWNQMEPSKKGRRVTDPGLLAQLEAPATALDRANAVGTGFNAGLAALAGMPVDTAANIIDLGKAGLGTAISQITGKAVPQSLEVNEDRSNVIGSTAWIRKFLDKNAVTNTTPSRPDDTVSQYLHAGASAVPGLLLAKAPASIPAAAVNAVEAAGIGMVPQAVADAGGNEGTQAVAGALASLVRPAGAALAPTGPKPVPKLPQADSASFLDGQKGLSQEELKARGVEYLRAKNVLVDEGQAAPAGDSKGNALRGLSRGADTVFGTGKFPVRQGESFVRAVLKEAELDGATRATPDAMAEIHKAVEQKYNALHDNVPTILDQPFRDKLEAFRTNARDLLGDSPEFQALSRQIDTLYERGQLTPEAKAAQEKAAAERKAADRIAQRRSEEAAARQADAEYARQEKARGEEAAKAQAEADRQAQMRMLSAGARIDTPAPPPEAPAAPRISEVERVKAKHAAEDAALAENALREKEAASIPGAPEPDRIISGRSAQAVRENLAKLQGGAANGVARDLAGQLKELLDDAFENSTTPENIEAMRKARRQFHRMKQIEDAVAGRADGIVTPERLMQVMSTKKNRNEAVYGKGEQELMNLARAGKMVLPENLGNSGTATREMDVMKVAAALTNPVLAAKVGGSLLGGRALNRRGATSKTAEAVQANIDRINEVNKRRAARALQHGPEPKVGSALTAESPEERKRRLRAEALRN